jgi:hypothetical protein
MQVASSLYFESNKSTYFDTTFEGNTEITKW